MVLYRKVLYRMVLYRKVLYRMVLYKKKVLYRKLIGLPTIPELGVSKNVEKVIPHGRNEE